MLTRNGLIFCLGEVNPRSYRSLEVERTPLGSALTVGFANKYDEQIRMNVKNHKENVKRGEL